VILFLNKRDMFEDKILKVPLTACPIFSNFTGPQTYEAGVEAIEDAFQSKNHNRDKVVQLSAFPHNTHIHLETHTHAQHQPHHTDMHTRH